MAPGWAPSSASGLAGSTLPARPPHSIHAPGRLINTIRVVCASYEDYSHWLLCLQTVCHGDRASPPPGPESLPGMRASTQVRSQQVRCCRAAVKQTGGPGHGEVGTGSCHLAHPYPSPAAQVVVSGRGSLSSDARTSWDSGCPAPPSTCTSHSLPESSAASTAGCPARPPPVSIWEGG